MKYRFKPNAALLGRLLRAAAWSESVDSPSLEAFKENAFDPLLRSHKIHRLFARFGRTIYAAEIEANLRAVFYVEGDIVVTVDIGSHDIYRG